MNGKTIIWILGDGKPGHENQSLGLAEAIARRVPSEIHPIAFPKKTNFLRTILATHEASCHLPKPRLILAAGHSTHPSLLWLSRRYEAPGIVLMKPSLPAALFDHVIAPEHDFPKPPKAENIILTKGALNRVLPTTGPREGKLVLIGGPSRTHGWNETELIQMLAKITDRAGWSLTDSRRTPPGFLERIRQQLPAIALHPHQQTAPGWLPRQLSKAKEVWVTEDSVSMIYEALSGGGKVGLLPVPRKQQSTRTLRGIDHLIASRYLTPWPIWLQTKQLPPPPQTLQEADRLANILLNTLS